MPPSTLTRIMKLEDHLFLSLPSPSYIYQLPILYLYIYITLYMFTFQCYMACFQHVEKKSESGLHESKSHRGADYASQVSQVLLRYAIKGEQVIKQKQNFRLLQLITSKIVELHFVPPRDSHHSEAMEDCIEFINSSYKKSL